MFLELNPVQATWQNSKDRYLDGSVSHKLQGGSGDNVLPLRPSPALNYVKVIFQKFISESISDVLSLDLNLKFILSCPMGSLSML